MLSVPSKETDQVDTSKPLLHFIEAHFGSAVRKQHEDAAADFGQLREGMRKASLSKSATGREILLNYYAQILSVEKRFPSGDVRYFILLNLLVKCPVQGFCCCVCFEKFPEVLTGLH